MAKLDTLVDCLDKVLGKTLSCVLCAINEVTVEIPAQHWKAAALQLRDHPDLQFESCLDVCGVDYSCYKDTAWQGPRFAAVYHLLSYTHNIRLRVRVFCKDDDFPLLPSQIQAWPSVNWYEREAFDLYGIVFEGHPDLRRILTDYGFIGHPFRKDFPISGYVEMRYDPAQGRVVYQPVTIEAREMTQRIVREEHYGGFRNP